jgi:hypothetical protein
MRQDGGAADACSAAIVAEAGETMVVPAGKIHNSAQQGDEPSQCRAPFPPAPVVRALMAPLRAIARRRDRRRAQRPSGTTPTLQPA